MIQREFYPLPMLANLWGITFDDLLHLGISDCAQICVNVYGIPRQADRTRIDTEIQLDENGNEITPQNEAEWNEFNEVNSRFEAWKSRTTHNMPPGIYELGIDCLRFINMPNGLPYELHEARKFDDGWFAVEFETPIAINIDHLCILHEEFERLNNKFKKGDDMSSKSVNTINSKTEIDSRERTTLLRIIRALSEMAKLPEKGYSTSIVTQLEMLGFNSPGDAAVSKKIKESRNLDPD